MDRQELFDLSSISKTYPELKILSIRNNCLSHLHGLPKGLVVLIAEGNRLSSLTSFRSTPNIRFLDISSNFITDLSALSHLHFLQELNVSRNQVTCIGPIRHLSKLSILNLSGNAIRRVEFAQREFEVLSVLDLRHNQIEILDGLHHLPAIQRVFADNNVLASLNLQGPISLEQLSLKCNNLSERSFHITNQVIISDLNLSENCFESLRVLPSSIMVQRLCISQQRNQSILLNSSIALWKMLTELDISGTIIESLDPFQAAENLKVLLARRCHLTSFSEALASSLQKLRTLCLGSNKITHLDPLVFLARLEYLDMSDNCLHTFRTTLSTVRKLKHLQFLDFRGNPITAKFYPPVSTTTRTQLKEQLFHSFSPMSCNNPKDVAADATLDWSQKDKEFCERAPDAWFIKRVCYRSILITSLHRLLKLDGVKILPEEQSSASYILKKMKKSVSQN
ncbi:hypothetical protein DFJ73DRAFT_863500 [Zopfochytrium polystomum]|nr:hypothetical protein DFJ73DRAFT_863500 [Zopfochytrium polystomum]